MLLIHQACLRHLRKNMLKHVNHAAPCICWQRYKRLLSLAACSKLELTITAVTLGSNDPPLLQGKPADFVLVTRENPLTPQSHVLDPAIICHNAWSKRPSSWSRCQPPKWPARSHSSSKPANVFVSSRLTWTTVFLIQIHLNFGYNEIRSLIIGVNSPMINHY